MAAPIDAGPLTIGSLRVDAELTDHLSLSTAHIVAGGKSVLDGATLAQAVYRQDVASPANGILPSGYFRVGAGGGYLPHMFFTLLAEEGHQELARTLAFSSLDAQTWWTLRAARPRYAASGDDNGTGLILRTRLHGVRTLAVDPGSFANDSAASRGLSYLDWDTAGQLAYELIPERLQWFAEVGARLDLQFLMELAPGTGMAHWPLTTYVETALRAQASGVAQVTVSSFVPLRSMTNTLPTEPTIALEVQGASPLLPSVRLTSFGARGVQEARAVWAVPLGDHDRWTVLAEGRVGLPFEGARRAWGFSLALSYLLSEHSPAPQRPHSFGWSETASPERPPGNHQATSVQVRAPRLLFPATAYEVAQRALKNGDWDKLRRVLDNPERIISFIDSSIEYRSPGASSQGSDRPLSPRELLAAGAGSCRDQHYAGAFLMRAHGIEAYQLGYSAVSKPHAVGVYRDKSSGAFNLWNYDRIYESQSRTPIAALAEAEPGWLEVHPYENRNSPDGSPRLSGVLWYHPDIIQNYFGFLVPGI